ncbi:MAG: zinc-dependent metalloprotease, partial [Bacteroidota bacterium]
YQAEAAAKMIGGLNYRYALRGDGQFTTEMIAPVQQIKSIDALLKTISPQTLMLPDHILKLMPPRPIGYNRSREVVKIRTDMTFDALGAAESAADMTISLMLHPSRAARLVEYHARSPQQPSLESVIDRLINATFKAGIKKDYEAAVRITVNDVVLTNLLELAASKQASAQVKAIAGLKLAQLRSWLSEVKETMPESLKAHYTFAVQKINRFESNPDEFQNDQLVQPPPGQPIGDIDELKCGDY